MPIRKALSIDGESKVVDYLLCGKYEITNTSWSKLQNKYNLSKNNIYSALKSKRRPRGSQYQQRKNKLLSQNLLCFILILLLNKLHYINIITCLF